MSRGIVDGIVTLVFVSIGIPLVVVVPISWSYHSTPVFTESMVVNSTLDTPSTVPSFSNTAVTSNESPGMPLPTLVTVSMV